MRTLELLLQSEKVEFCKGGQIKLDVSRFTKTNNEEWLRIVIDVYKEAVRRYGDCVDVQFHINHTI